MPLSYTFTRLVSRDWLYDIHQIGHLSISKLCEFSSFLRDFLWYSMLVFNHHSINADIDQFQQSCKTAVINADETGAIGARLAGVKTEILATAKPSDLLQTSIRGNKTGFISSEGALYVIIHYTMHITLFKILSIHANIHGFSFWLTMILSLMMFIDADWGWLMTMFGQCYDNFMTMLWQSWGRLGDIWRTSWTYFGGHLGHILGTPWGYLGDI